VASKRLVDRLTNIYAIVKSNANYVVAQREYKPVVLFVVPVVFVAGVPARAPARVRPPRASLTHARCAIPQALYRSALNTAGEPAFNQNPTQHSTALHFDTGLPGCNQFHLLSVSWYPARLFCRLPQRREARAD
jgi:hypothetical protein